MLEQLDLDVRLSKSEYRRRLPDLQARLYDMEQAILEARLPVAILFEGWAGTSKVRTISALTRRLDPRGLRVHSITPPRTFETQYPWLYRFWLKTPSYGRIAIFDRSWYREVLTERTRGGGSPDHWRERCEDITSFERQLAADGTVILKFWLHISRKEQAHRFKRLRKDPLTSWQVTDDDRWQQRNYDQVYAAAEDLILRTDTAAAPWNVIAATDNHHARITVIETILASLEARLGRAFLPTGNRESLEASGVVFRPRSANGAAAGQGAETLLIGDSARPHPGAQPATPLEGGLTEPRPLAPPPLGPAPSRTRHDLAILNRVDLSQRLDEKIYTKRLKQLQAKLHLLGLKIYQQQRPVILVFEGWDAAGKGGAILRLTEKLDPRGYIVHAIAAPSGDDKEHHYLYRFWRRLPPRGQIAIFDRSWYGRVLVERVEGFARPEAWQRAYAELNEFERQLVEFGTIICKFWLHLSPEEQLRRFEERQNVPYKAWKLTDEDWRNREKWPQYEEAVNEMLVRTSTPAAPWTIVESEDKRFARVKVLSTVVQRLESELGEIAL